MSNRISISCLAAIATTLFTTATSSAQAPTPINLPRPIDQTVECEALIVGGGLAGTATAYESLLAGRTVCLTDLTDWIGGQISTQGTSALDEAKKQRQLRFYAKGYNELRDRIQRYYKNLNPGGCWVSVSCFLPRDANTLLQQQLAEAAKRGKGQLKWFPSTVIKELEISADGRQIQGVIALQHRPAPNTPPPQYRAFVPNH